MSVVSTKLEGLIRGLRPCQVAVIGDVMLDHYVRGNADRLSPEAPIQVLDVTDESHMPGGAANVAMKVVGLEAKVRMVGLVGPDRAGEQLRALLVSHPDVSDSLIVDPGRSTTLKTRFIAHNQQLLRVDRERRVKPTGDVITRLAEAAREAAADADAVILEDYGKGVLCPEVIAAAIEGARARGAPVIVDPTGRDYRRYAGATVLTPNLKEAAVAAERPITDLSSLEGAASLLVEQTDAALAVTREADGISLFRRQRPGQPVEHTHVPTVPVAVFDVTGAGDAVAASLAIALACGTEMVNACAWQISPAGLSSSNSESGRSPSHTCLRKRKTSQPTGWSRSWTPRRLASVLARSSTPGARSCSPTAASTSSTTATPTSCSSLAARVIFWSWG